MRSVPFALVLASAAAVINGALSTDAPPDSVVKMSVPAVTVRVPLVPVPLAMPKGRASPAVGDASIAVVTLGKLYVIGPLIFRRISVIRPPVAGAVLSVQLVPSAQ